MTRRSQHSRNKEAEASVDCGRVKRIASRSSDGAARGDDIHALQPSPCSKFCSRNAREPPTARLSISEPGVQPPRHVTIRFHVLPMSCASWTGGPALGRSHAWAFTKRRSLSSQRFRRPGAHAVFARPRGEADRRRLADPRRFASVDSHDRSASQGEAGSVGGRRWGPGFRSEAQRA
jgi:hypothetical protein